MTIPTYPFQLPPQQGQATQGSILTQLFYNFQRALFLRTGGPSGVNSTVGVGLKATGQTLSDDYNEVINPGSFVVLANLQPGQQQAVYNGTGATLSVHAFGAGSIDGAATFDLANGTIQIFTAVALLTNGSPRYRSMQISAAAGPGPGPPPPPPPPPPPGTEMVTGQCYLKYVSHTQIALVPYAGNGLVINGTLYNIPAAGLTAGINHIFIDGVFSAGGFPATVGLYDVYQFNNGDPTNLPNGLQFDFVHVATGAPPLLGSTHSMDTSANNIGVEIHTGDPTRSYVGKVCIDQNGQFASQQSLGGAQPLNGGQAFDAIGNQGLGVLSWFNRRRCHLGLTTAPGHQTTTTIVELAGTRCYYLSFGQDAVAVKAQYLLATNNAPTAYAALQAYIDGQTPGSVPWTPSNRYLGVGSWGQTFSPNAIGVWAIFNGNPPEGLHYNSAWMSIGLGSGTAGCSPTVDGDTHVDVVG